MSDLPQLKSRDMATHLALVAGTHQQIAQGIRERAAEHEAYQAKRDAELNAGAKLRGY